MRYLFLINCIVGILFFVCYAYQLAYVAVAFVKKPKPHKKQVLHKFAVLISARNEEAVIADLISSIKSQTYPSHLITTFVVADNCTDKTAQIARKAGAVVYERQNRENIGKGYALDFLINKIFESRSDDAFDAFFIFDADNILDPNYILEMNKTYSDGYKIITSYRNSKNFGDNWISAGYALWFLREAKYLNYSRHLLGTSCAVSGTGFMFDRSIIESSSDKKKGWKYHLLTEDIEFTASNIINGEKIGYCDEAHFYDEQPTKFKESWNQRMRWAKGYLQVFANYGKELTRGIFRNRKDKRPKNNFSCLDMSMTIMPALILSSFVIIADFIGSLVNLFYYHDIRDAIALMAMPLINASLIVFIVGIITTITEWNNIHTTPLKKILYSLTFPMFMITYIPIAISSLFAKVDWKPIRHEKSVTISEIKSCGQNGSENKKSTIDRYHAANTEL